MSHTLKVLLAEDDADDKDLFIQAVEQLNLKHQIIWAKNSSELFAALEREPDLDLGILDINLPGIDGKKCLIKIKAHEKYKKLPVIIMTVSKSIDDINDVYKSGAHYYVIKPYSERNYSETLKRIFGIDWKTEQPIPPKSHFIINLAFV
jgi:two-component system, response regulator